VFYLHPKCAVTYKKSADTRMPFLLLNYLLTVNEKVPEYPAKKTLDCQAQTSIKRKKDW